jgi:UDP:flavonoid glycosyltransferase YjiC (YdhE family)
MNDASLVISHCGAGSTFEALTKGVPVLVVPNPILMDNHQQELANTLSQQGYLVCSRRPLSNLWLKEALLLALGLSDRLDSVEAGNDESATSRMSWEDTRTRADKYLHAFSNHEQHFLMRSSLVLLCRNSAHRPH